MQINQAVLVQLAEDVGEEMLPLIIENFCGELQSLREELAQMAEAGKVAEVAELVHKLKSISRTVGLVALSEQAAVVEADARDGHEGDALAATAPLLRQCTEGLSLLQNWKP